MVFSWKSEQLTTRINMKENKTCGVGVRLNGTQEAFLQKLISEGKAKSVSNAIQYLINLSIIKGE